MDNLRQYDPMCGLSQDEYRRLLDLRKLYYEDKMMMSRMDLCIMVESLENIAEHLQNQIDDLLEKDDYPELDRFHG